MWLSSLDTRRSLLAAHHSLFPVTAEPRVMAPDYLGPRDCSLAAITVLWLSSVAKYGI